MEVGLAVAEKLVKVEPLEVKAETAEIDNGSAGHITWGPAIETDEVVLNRVKKEQDLDEAWSSEEVFNENIKVEEDLDCKQFETEDGLIKNENDYDVLNDANSEILTNSAEEMKIPRKKHTEDKPKMCSHCNATFKRKINLDEHILRKHPYSMTFVSSKIHVCLHCMYKSTRNDNFVRHMLRHAEAADNYKLKTCIHCNTTFERKKHLDEHTVCEHPDFIASVSSKIHQCTRCTFKTVMKANLARHMLKHPDSSNLSRCIYCNATYKSKRNMDNHIIRKHPDSIASVSSKIHECKYCMYKTTVKAQFSEHMTQHYETADSYKLRCGQCDAIFRRKSSLDEHIVRKHPNSIASVSSKIHECTYCAYQTVIKPHFARHMLKHPETADSYKLSRCIHCNAIYKRKMSLDDHILRRHPEHIASVSNKIHECTHCAFKTVMKAQLAHHMLKHPETADGYKFSTCVHCNATFKGKQALDDHTLRKHPDTVGSISTKIYECTHCPYKTSMKSSFAKHILKHP